MNENFVTTSLFKSSLASPTALIEGKSYQLAQITRPQENDFHLICYFVERRLIFLEAALSISILLFKKNESYSSFADWPGISPSSVPLMCAAS